MQYSIMGTPDTQIGDINVNVVDPRHVRVTFLDRSTDSTGVEVLINDRDDIVSVNSGVVRDTSYWSPSVNGMSTSNEEDSAELGKCSDEFQASEQKYYERKNLVDKGEVTGQIPK